MDDLRFKSWQQKGIFLFSERSRPAVGPNYPAIEWVSRTVSMEYSNWDMRLTTHFHLVLRLRTYAFVACGGGGDFSFAFFVIFIVSLLFLMRILYWILCSIYYCMYCVLLHGDAKS
jgi:hypothetical protein